MAGAQAEGVTYKVKTIDFLRRKVPVVMQNQNGPCPLLALANVLLLRNQIYLPANTPDVSQDRLISLVAGYLLDANNDDRLAQTSEEYRANLRQNVADAISLLPKLATGIDVNVRFHDIRGFEFTQDTAIFDLLDVRLVHGWLIDPQDTARKKAIGQQSYNELVSMLVSTLGDDTPPHLLTPPAIAAHSREASFSGRHSGGSAGLLARLQSAQAAPAKRDAKDVKTGEASEVIPADRSGMNVANLGAELQGMRLDDDDSQALQQALELSMAASGPAQCSMLAEASSSGGNTALADVATAQPHSGSLEKPAGDAAKVEDKQGTLNAFATQQLAGPAVSQDTTTGTGSPGAEAVYTAGDAAPNSIAYSMQPSGVGAPSTALSRCELASQAREIGSSDQLPRSQLQVVGYPSNEHRSGSAESCSDWVKLPPMDQERSAHEAAQSTSLPLTQGTGKQVEAGSSTSVSESPAEPEASSSGTHNPGPSPLRSGQELPPQVYDDATLAKGKMPAFVDVDPEDFRRQQEEAAQVPIAASAATPPTLAEVENYEQSEQQAQELQRAHVIQAFLENTSSQLTQHGLLSLHQGLRANELAVLFRNNHFNTIFSHDGAMWILVTDQGYLFEQNVVWERLCDVNGNTEFAKSDFSRFIGQPATQDVTVAAGLAQAAFASVVPPRGLPDPGATADPDADMALAIQLQEEENARQQAFLAQQQQQQQVSQPQQGNAPPPKVSVTGRQHQAESGGAGRHRSGSGTGRRAGKKGTAAGKEKEDKCSIM